MFEILQRVVHTLIASWVELTKAGCGKHREDRVREDGRCYRRLQIQMRMQKRWRRSPTLDVRDKQEAESA